MGAYAGTLRRLMPGLAIAAVLALSYLMPSTAFGASDPDGFGYGNNCGVKGYGYHDHGKPCPNRPFPGQGKGVLRILHGALTGDEDKNETGGSGGTSTKSQGTNSHGKSQVTATVTNTAGATSAGSTKGHNGHGKAKGHGHLDDGGTAGI